MEYVLMTASSRYLPEDLSTKCLRKHSWQSLILIILQTLDLKLYGHNPTVYEPLQTLKISQNIFCLKNLLRVPLAGLYSVKTYLQNTSKTLPKISNLCSLYAENYLLNRNYTHPRILRNFKSVAEILTFSLLRENKENFSNKENCFVRGRCKLLN